MPGQFRAHVAIDMCDIKNVILVKKLPPDTEEERPDGAFLSLLSRCPNSSIECIQQYLYFDKEDYIAHSYRNNDFDFKTTPIPVEYHFYSIQPYESLNCIEIAHSSKVKPGN